MENLREIALDGLLALEREDKPSHQLIRGILEKYDYLDSQEKAFLKRLLEGTLERRIELDYVIDSVSSVPVKKMKPLIRNLTRMSVYQLLYMDAVPDSAACNEACRLAAKRGFSNLKGFVNGVLRRIAREKDHLPLPDPQRDILSYLSVKYSMPAWIVQEWMEEYVCDGKSGAEMAETILKGLLEVHPVSLRIPETLSDQETGDVAARLVSAGAALKENPYLERMYTADGLDNLGELQDFMKGRLIVQDVSSVLAVKAAGIRPGDFVIDACASPGGKSVLAAELAGTGGRVLAGDVSEKKAERIRENIVRMKADTVSIRIWDAREPDPELFQKADVLLLDVPCSGLGVIGKKRDIKYRVSEEGLRSLEELQREIVRGAWQYVKPGGILLYSTCTIRRQENRDMAAWILREFPFEPVPILEDFPEAVRRGVLREKACREKAEPALEDCSAQLLPGVLEMDGFFFAKLRRTKES